MIDLKSALESVQYNTGALGGNSSNPTSNLQQQTGGNTGILASILQKIAPTLASGGTIPPVA